MDAKEFRQKSAAELREELLKLRREQFNMRMAMATGQAVKPHQISNVRKAIACLKTVQSEQRHAANQGAK
jgi:large subunit ribosomal protein L29